MRIRQALCGVVLLTMLVGCLKSKTIADHNVTKYLLEDGPYSGQVQIIVGSQEPVQGVITMKNMMMTMQLNDGKTISGKFINSDNAYQEDHSKCFEGTYDNKPITIYSCYISTHAQDPSVPEGAIHFSGRNEEMMLTFENGELKD